MLGAAWERLKSNEKLHMAWCVTGIIGCLMMYGVLQERLMTQQYCMSDTDIGAEGTPSCELFKYSLFLVLNNRVMTMLVAFICLLMYGHSLAPAAPIHNYAAVSVSNVVATTCQYEALRHVSFPVQTLGKCAKMIPVMIWGKFISGKKYGPKDYLVAVVVTLGCTLFLTMGNVSSIKSKASGDSGSFGFALWGVSLMGGYLAFDGFTSTFQEKLFKGYNMVIYNQILYVTGCSAIFSVLGLLSTQQMLPALAFVGRHADSMMDIIILSLSATIGQLFISHTIKTFGALVFATVMTTRQFLSILLSCILYLHPLTVWQWFGTVMVFGALYYKSLAKKPKGNDSGSKEGGKHPEETLPLSTKQSLDDLLSIEKTQVPPTAPPADEKA